MMQPIGFSTFPQAAASRYTAKPRQPQFGIIDGGVITCPAAAVTLCSTAMIMVGALLFGAVALAVSYFRDKDKKTA